MWAPRVILCTPGVDSRRKVIDEEPVTPDDVFPLEVLLELSSSASEDPLPTFLRTVGEIICGTAGFSTVVLNLFRPAWDDYEAALVIGRKESVEMLMGTSTPRGAL